MAIHQSCALNPLVNPARPGDTINMPDGRQLQVGSSVRYPLTVIQDGRTIYETASQIDLIAWFDRQEGYSQPAACAA